MMKVACRNPGRIFTIPEDRILQFLMFEIYLKAGKLVSRGFLPGEVL